MSMARLGLFYSTNSILVLLLKLDLVVYSENLLLLADATSRGLVYVRLNMLQVCWEGDRVACLY